MLTRMLHFGSLLLLHALSCYVQLEFAWEDTDVRTPWYSYVSLGECLDSPGLRSRRPHCNTDLCAGRSARGHRHHSSGRGANFYAGPCRSRGLHPYPNPSPCDANTYSQAGAKGHPECH